MIPREQIEELDRLAEKATPGPWDVCGATHVWSPTGKANVASCSELRGISHVGYDSPSAASGNLHEIAANARLIAALRNAWPEIRRALSADRDALLRECLQIAERSPELNMSNYTEDQVAELNQAMIDLTLKLRAALAKHAAPQKPTQVAVSQKENGASAGAAPAQLKTAPQEPSTPTEWADSRLPAGAAPDTEGGKDESAR